MIVVNVMIAFIETTSYILVFIQCLKLNIISLQVVAAPVAAPLEPVDDFLVALQRKAPRVGVVRVLVATTPRILPIGVFTLAQRHLRQVIRLFVVELNRIDFIRYACALPVPIIRYVVVVTRADFRPPLVFRPTRPVLFLSVLLHTVMVSSLEREPNSENIDDNSNDDGDMIMITGVLECSSQCMNMMFSFYKNMGVIFYESVGIASNIMILFSSLAALVNICSVTRCITAFRHGTLVGRKIPRWPRQSSVHDLKKIKNHKSNLTKTNCNF